MLRINSKNKVNTSVADLGQEESECFCYILIRKKTRIFNKNYFSVWSESESKKNPQIFLHPIPEKTVDPESGK
jgi:hypothetical protein